jgi:hypothetical protein
MKNSVITTAVTTALVLAASVLPVEVFAVPITGDYSAIQTGVENEWVAAKPIVMALAAALLAVGLMWKFSKRFVKTT